MGPRLHWVAVLAATALSCIIGMTSAQARPKVRAKQVLAKVDPGVGWYCTSFDESSSCHRTKIACQAYRAFTNAASDVEYSECAFQKKAAVAASYAEMQDVWVISAFSTVKSCKLYRDVVLEAYPDDAGDMSDCVTVGAKKGRVDPFVPPNWLFAYLGGQEERYCVSWGPEGDMGSVCSRTPTDCENVIQQAETAGAENIGQCHRTRTRALTAYVTPTFVVLMEDPGHCDNTLGSRNEGTCVPMTPPHD
jgi:hypothetical protein